MNTIYIFWEETVLFNIENIYTYGLTKTSEDSLSAFIYRLFHEDLSLIIGTNSVGYSL